MERPAESLLDLAQTTFNRVPNHSQSVSGGGNIALGFEIGIQRVTRHLAAIAQAVERRQEGLYQRGGQGLMLQHGCLEQDIGAPCQARRLTPRDQQRRLSFPMCQTPSLNSPSWLAHRKRNACRTLNRQALEVRGRRLPLAAKPDPCGSLVMQDGQALTTKSRLHTPDGLSDASPCGDHANVPGVKVIIQLGRPIRVEL